MAMAFSDPEVLIAELALTQDIDRRRTINSSFGSVSGFTHVPDFIGGSNRAETMGTIKLADPETREFIGLADYTGSRGPEFEILWNRVVSTGRNTAASFTTSSSLPSAGFVGYTSESCRTYFQQALDDPNCDWYFWVAGEKWWT
jgi:hypothetical protein